MLLVWVWKLMKTWYARLTRRMLDITGESLSGEGGMEMRGSGEITRVTRSPQLEGHVIHCMSVLHSLAFSSL
jgi:hypothetical protein